MPVVWRHVGRREPAEQPGPLLRVQEELEQHRPAVGTRLQLRRRHRTSRKLVEALPDPTNQSLDNNLEVACCVGDLRTHGIVLPQPSDPVRRPPPEFTRAWETARLRGQIHTVAIREPMRWQFGSAQLRSSRVVSS